MGSSIYNIGVTGLNAAQLGLLTSGHNIANASTPGFNRQQILLATNTPQFSGSGFLGQGVNVESVQRIYNQYLANQVTSSQSRLSELDAYSAQIKQIDNLLADASAGLSPALQAFFTSVNAVGADPSSIPARQSMLSGAQSLAGRFQSLNGRFDEIREGVDTQIISTVNTINSYATQIADINQRIILAQVAGPGRPANDLLDQRDQLIADLNKLVGVNTVSQADGTLSVFVGNGQQIVVGNQTFALAAISAPDDSSRITVGIKQFGNAAPLPENVLTGGELGGLLAFRSGSLDTAQNALGRVALGLAATFNDQHRLGQDLTGALGGDFFTAPMPQVIYPNNPVNAGNAVIDVALASASALTTSDYRLTANGGGNYTLTRLSDNTALFSAAPLPQTVDGLTISLNSGAANAGDTFLIQPTRHAAGSFGVAVADTRNIAAAAPIRSSASLANTGTATITPGSVDSPPPPNPALQDTVTITFTGANTFDVVDTTTATTLASGAAYTAGANIGYNGWTLQISGTPAMGDVFTVSANTSGISDNRNALLLAGLQTAKTLSGGSASYQTAYAQIVSDAGNKAREIEVTDSAQQNIFKQAQDAQQSFSGVNLDEEAANLLHYQQLYQASGKMIDIAGKLFDLLLNIS